jgi:hypothetical protein
MVESRRITCSAKPARRRLRAVCSGTRRGEIGRNSLLLWRFERSAPGGPRRAIARGARFIALSRAALVLLRYRARRAFGRQGAETRPAENLLGQGFFG